MATKYTFSKKPNETFTFSEQRQKELEPKLITAYEAVADLRGTMRVHPDIKAFAAAAWHEAASRLQFATPERTYAQCSREAARRSPWFYFAQGAQGDFSNFDVDVQEVQ